MPKRAHLIVAIPVSAALGVWVGRLFYADALRFFFANYAVVPERAASAGWSFSIGLGFVFALLFFSALVTEKFSANGRYLPSIGKSFFVCLLLLLVSGFYEDQVIRSNRRISSTLRIPLAPGWNPLLVAIWTTAAGLLLFGPVDLWIARLQARSRRPAEAAPEKRL